MEKEINRLIGNIKAEYIKFATSNGTKELSGYFKETVANFDKNIGIKKGKKYIKICTNERWFCLGFYCRY